MRPRDRILRAINRLVVVTTLLGTVVTICAVSLANAAGLSTRVQAVLAQSGAGLTAFVGVALYNFFTLVRRS